jgi:hypothetical protein
VDAVQPSVKAELVTPLAFKPEGAVGEEVSTAEAVVVERVALLEEVFPAASYALSLA